MLRRSLSFISAALCFLTGVTVIGSADEPAAGTPAALHEAPCKVGATNAKAVCGTYAVFEDRTARSGRVLKLHFTLIKARHQTKGTIAFNPGGPGASAVDDAPLFAQDNGPFASLHDRYDILLVDNRGTGASAPQNCDFAPRADKALYFTQLWPDAAVRACRERLAAHANLSLYSTSVAVDDLDDLRGALGIAKLSLFGGSYGTRMYLAYARQHPEHVASIVLDGVAPPHFFIIPLPMAQGAQASIDQLIMACSRDASCAKQFPRFNERFNALVRRFDAGPVRVTLVENMNGATLALPLSKEVFVETIRHALYFPGDAATLPVVVERAYLNDYRPLAALVDKMSQGFAQIQAGGLNLSVTCAEDIPFITESDVRRTSIHTFEGDARVRAQQRACRIWHVKPVSAGFIEPVKSELPMLMISGTDDPAAPPQFARAAAQYLPNARIMLVPGASHDSDYPACVYSTMLAFFDAANASNLPLDKCAATYRRPRFELYSAFESAPGAKASVTARMKELLARIIAGRIDRSELTPQASNALPPAAITQLGRDLSTSGALTSVVFRSASSGRSGVSYRYLAHFELGDVIVSATIGADGKIAALDVTPE